MLRLVFPKRQSITYSRSILNLYDQALNTKEKEIMFDLSRSESITPFSLLIHAALINKCLKGGKKGHYIKPEKRPLQRYLKDMGFNEFFWPKDNLEKFVPISIDRVQLRRPSGIDYQLAEQVITVFDKHLNLSKGVKESLNMSIRETMTNAVDHSGENEYYICAQASSKRRQILLCILDLGKGILGALKPKYPYLNDDYEAIEEAIKEGISSRDSTAGFGLNHIKRFIEVNRGKMWIISGHGKVMWNGSPMRSHRQSMIVPFSGTIVKLLIHIDRETFYLMSDEVEKLF